MKFRLLPTVLAFACISAVADPVAFTFDLRYDDWDMSLWPGHFAVDGPIAATGTQTFSTENGKLLDLSFTMPFGTYDLQGGHPNWVGGPQLPPEGPSWVTFENGVLTDIHYRVKTEGCDECMINRFLTVDGRRAWSDALGGFSVQNVTPVPEPSSVLLLLCGLAALARTVRSRRTTWAGATVSLAATPAAAAGPCAAAAAAG